MRADGASREPTNQNANNLSEPEISGLPDSRNLKHNLSKCHKINRLVFKARFVTREYNNMFFCKTHNLRACFLFVLALTLVGSGCSGPVAGIDTPIIVNDVEFKVVSAGYNERIVSIGGMNKALVVRIEVISGAGNPIEWDIWLTNSKGGMFKPGFTSAPSHPGAEQHQEYLWGFGVSGDSDSFTLHLPEDKTIALDSLINAKAQAVTEQVSAEPEELSTEPEEIAECDKSIAVLPFINMSSEPEQEFFSNGITEELLHKLTKIPQLHVVDHMSSFAYKGKGVSITDVSRELHVAHVLEGSVRKSENRARITAQLIRAEDEFHLWSNTYDRTLDEVPVVQDEIIAAVVGQINDLRRCGHGAVGSLN